MTSPRRKWSKVCALAAKLASKPANAAALGSAAAHLARCEKRRISTERRDFAAAGGKARAAKLSPERRSEIARKGAEAREAGRKGRNLR